MVKRKDFTSLPDYEEDNYNHLLMLNILFENIVLRYTR